MTPILSAGKSVVSASKNLLGAMKGLVVEPGDSELWKKFQTHSKALSDAMKVLLGAIK